MNEKEQKVGRDFKGEDEIRLLRITNNVNIWNGHGELLNVDIFINTNTHRSI